MKGKLYIVATPIGNLGDITLRALETLKTVDIIVAEDTRHTLKLLNHYNIKKRLISLHKFSEDKRYAEIIDLLLQNSIAIVSDAGTPTISDPGYELVKRAINKGIEVESLPGACAAITALTLSAMPTDNFAFYGFLDTKKTKSDLITIKEKGLLSVIYESPKRLKKTMSIIAEVFSDTQVAVFRELTKKFEESIRGTATEVFKQINSREEIKGEIVIVIGEVLPETLEVSEEEILRQLTVAINEGLSKKDAAALVAKNLNIAKNKTYGMVIGIK